MHLGDKTYWVPTTDSDPVVRALADRHYSRKTPGSPRTAGPGEVLVLRGQDYRAAFIWRIQRYRQDGQEGVECTLFRNEGTRLSSELIKEAEEWARLRWPGVRRFFTYINPKKVKSPNPGYCFLCAGWKRVETRRGKIVIAKEVKP